MANIAQNHYMILKEVEEEPTLGDLSYKSVVLNVGSSEAHFLDEKIFAAHQALL